MEVNRRGNKIIVRDLAFFLASFFVGKAMFLRSEGARLGSKLENYNAGETSQEIDRLR